MLNCGAATPEFSKAIVESWGTDDELRQLWLDQMNAFTQAAAARIRTDSVALEYLNGLEVDAVAASLTWLGERMYYRRRCWGAAFQRRDRIDRHIDQCVDLEHLWPAGSSAS